MEISYYNNGRKVKIDAKNIFFTADFHHSHCKILKYAERPFKDVEEMNEALLRNYNSIVSKDDTVFFLGDIAFGLDNAVKCLNSMNGTVHFILGNHDKEYEASIRDANNVASVNNLLDIEIDGQPITLCHYALRVWHKSHFDSYMLYAHSHNRLEPEGKQLDVGVDAHNFKPVDYGHIKFLMKMRPHNFNYISEDKRR
jgi:calcineurin-like phosphoesterase family protein